MSNHTANWAKQEREKDTEQQTILWANGLTSFFSQRQAAFVFASQTTSRNQLENYCRFLHPLTFKRQRLRPHGRLNYSDPLSSVRTFLASSCTPKIPQFRELIFDMSKNKMMRIVFLENCVEGQGGNNVAIKSAILPFRLHKGFSTQKT
jgi:hypothetical protein